MTGCGGGGGGGGGSSSNPPSAARTRVTATITWPTRSRAVNAPASALSGVIVLTGANPTGGDFVWAFNRDSNRSDSYTETITSPGEAKFGTWNMTLRFFTQGGGAGDVVALANKQVSVAQGSNLGDLTVNNAVHTVEVSPGQKVAVGQSLRPVFTAKNAQGTTIAVSPQSGLVQVVSGSDKLSANGGEVQGVRAGVARITITVDGKTSAPQDLAVGQASLILSAENSKGYIPLGVHQSGIQTFQVNVAPFAPFTMAADWVSVAQVTAPANYGDRQFLRWRLNNSDLGTNPAVSVNLIQQGEGTLTAVYGPRQPQNNAFTPNFFQTSFKRWASFPVKVFFHPGNGMNATQQDRIRQAIDFWVAASGDRISYQVVNSAAQAHISYRFGDTPAGVNGFCDSQWDGNDLLLRGDVTLDKNLAQPGQETNLALAARHEFGHALGMTGEQAGAGHSTDPNDTMFATGNPAIGVITGRDINTLATLYLNLLTRSRGRAEVQPGAPVGQARVFCQH